MEAPVPLVDRHIDGPNQRAIRTELCHEEIVRALRAARLAGERPRCRPGDNELISCNRDAAALFGGTRPDIADEIG
jgi:hypothetical protein